MPTLDWIGKNAVVNHHQTVPFRLLRPEPELAVNAAETGNLLVEGDNLLALKALLPRYAGQVKCIYIDPPYNTGNEGWIYNDAVNAPEIQKWLHKTVGKEAEDLSRHDKWLCMMYPRLQLLRQFLRDDGFIAVSIAEEEIASLRLLMNEVFGIANHRNTIVVRRYDKNLSRQFIDDGLTSLSVGFEYVMIFARSDKAKLRPVYREASEERQAIGYWKGFWNAPNRPTMRYLLLGVKPETGQWKWQETVGLQAVENYKIYQRDHAAEQTLEEYWEATGKNLKFIRRNLNGKGANLGVEHWIPPSTGVLRTSNWTDQLASESLTSLNLSFDNPKHTGLMKTLIKMLCDEDSLVLDSFAGSGTTGHAVMQLNREDGGNRRFLLVEMEPNIARNVTAERLRRVLCGVPAPLTNGDGNETDAPANHASGLFPDEDAPKLPAPPSRAGTEASPNAAKRTPEGFRFYTLGDPLFADDGSITPDVPFPDLARHVFYAATAQPLPDDAQPQPPRLGVSTDGVAVYLLWNGTGADPLTTARLRDLPPHDGPKIVYAASCRLPRVRLESASVTFRQFPYRVAAP